MKRHTTGKVRLTAAEHQQVLQRCVPWDPGTWIRDTVLRALQTEGEVPRDPNASLISQKDRTVTFRLSEDEKIRIDAQRVRYGDTRTRFIRTVLLHALQSPSATVGPEQGVLGTPGPTEPTGPASPPESLPSC